LAIGLSSLINFEELYNKALEMAEEAHKSQDYGGKPYTAHLRHVQQVLERFGYHPYIKEKEDHVMLSRQLIIAAILHDIVEDTGVTLEEIDNEFGSEIASLVGAVTNEFGINRLERHSKTYPKIKATPNAIILKLADRIANIESCLALRDSRYKMYLKESKNFEASLRTNGQHDDMWNYISKLLS
jgi:(p)ppGpp synthase/HD superfamily hydrolase